VHEASVVGGFEGVYRFIDGNGAESVSSGDRLESLVVECDARLGRVASVESRWCKAVDPHRIRSSRHGLALRVPERKAECRVTAESGGNLEYGSAVL